MVMPPFLDVIVIPTEAVLKPGELVSLFKRKIAVEEVRTEKPDPKAIVGVPTVRVPAGRYKIAFSEFVRDKLLLSTGLVEVEVTDKSDPSRPERAGEPRLTVDQAKTLLPQAAGIRNADFEALQGDPRPETVESKSLSLVLLALKPPVKNADAAAAEFRVLGENLKVSDITQAMWISKGEGYASFLQPKYITDCTCESAAGRAEGVVTFRSDLFAGGVPFVARATGDGWAVTEFRLPQYGTKVVLGDDGIWRQVSTEGEPKPATDKPVAPPVKGDEDKEAATAWGKEIGGLQVGLSIRNRRTIHIGGRAEAAVHLRNVGTETITVSAWPFWVSGPRVVDPRGNPVRTTSPPTPAFEIIPARLTVKPGQAVLVAKNEHLRRRRPGQGRALPGRRRGSVHHPRPARDVPSRFPGVRAGTPRPGDRHRGLRGDGRRGGRAHRLGQGVGGLQAGLGYRPGEKRVYRHGETVKLVVRVRNVGKEEVKFSVLPQEFFTRTRPP